MNEKEIEKILNFLEDVWEYENSPLKVYGNLEKSNPFQILISTILSSRTKDKITYTAADRLFKIFKTPQELANANVNDIEKIIYPVGFYKTKAKIIKKVSEIIIQKYNGKLPQDLNSLLSLPGVGRKTANLVLSIAFNKDTICVDTHVHRISNRIGIVSSKTPQETEIKLKETVPKKYWKKINKLMVSFGQTICKPIKPECERCKISDICVYYKTKKC